MSDSQTFQQHLQECDSISPTKLAALARFECLRQEEAAYEFAGMADPVRDNPERVFIEYMAAQHLKILSSVLSCASENGWNLTGLRLNEEPATPAKRLEGVLSALEAMTRGHSENAANGPNEKLDLSPVQDAVYGALTNDFQSVANISKSARVDESHVRRELPNLKRMGLVEHERGGYKRACANARALRA